MLIFCTQAIAANWLRLTESDVATYYFDTTSVTKSGDIRQVKELHDLKRPDTSINSFTGIREYDCKLKRSRSIKSFGHLQKMGGGTSAELNTPPHPTTWQDVKPNTVGWFYLSFLC